jgi:hypothetical protein
MAQQPSASGYTAPPAGQQALQIDYTSLIASLNAMIQVLGLNSRSLLALLESGIVVDGAPVKGTHIGTAGTFVVQSEPGALLSLNINTGAIASNGTFYDAASAAAIAGSLEIGVYNFGSVTIPTPTPIGPAGRGVTLNNGLVIITTGSADITVGTTIG